MVAGRQCAPAAGPARQVGLGRPNGSDGLLGIGRFTDDLEVVAQVGPFAAGIRPFTGSISKA